MKDKILPLDYDQFSVDQLTEKVNKILDRKEAIEYAIKHLTDNEMLLIAGKGHENFQEFKNEKRIFSDQETVKKCIGLKV